MLKQGWHPNAFITGLTPPAKQHLLWWALPLSLDSPKKAEVGSHCGHGILLIISMPKREFLCIVMLSLSHDGVSLSYSLGLFGNKNKLQNSNVYSLYCSLCQEHYPLLCSILHYLMAYERYHSKARTLFPQIYQEKF